MKKTVLFPKLLFEESFIYALGYWLTFGILIVMYFVATHSFWGMIEMALCLIILPNGILLFFKPICVITPEYVRIYACGRIIAALPCENIQLVGVQITQEGAATLWLTSLTEKYFCKYLSKHEKTTQALYPGKSYEKLLGSERGKMKAGIAAYLARNPHGKANETIIFQLKAQQAKKITHTWKNVVVIDKKS